jgi:uncharacterized tellurite resistance protein B-like protein
MTDQVETTASIETPVDTSNEQGIETNTNPIENVENVEAKVEKPIEPNFPEDWREKYAKGDVKKLNHLNRYASFEAALDAKFEAQKKISSYKPSVELPENPTEEDIKNYRKAYSIPEDPKGYDLKLDNGLVIGDEDMPIVEKFLERAHGRNAKPNEIKATLQDYFEVQQAENQQVLERFETQKQKAEDELRAEWGINYRQNANIVNNFLENKFGEQSNNLMNAVLADGTLLKNNPAVIRQLLNLAQDVDPVATLGRASSYDATSIDSEIADIEKTMEESPTKYFADKSMTKKYEELVIAREKMKSR